MKGYRIRFYARVCVVGMLGAVGMTVLSGEPAGDANFVAVVCCQLVVAALCWLVAWLLSKRWHLTRILNMIRLVSR